MDEPIEVDVRIVAREGRVCIARSHWFNVDMSRFSVGDGLYKGLDLRNFCRYTIATLFPLCCFYIDVVPRLP